MGDNAAIFSALKAAADAQGNMSFDDFTRVCLFDPQAGYYARAGVKRVGKTAEADFYTACQASGGVFAPLLLEAFKNLAGEAFCREAVLVEIWAEPQSALFARTPEGFGGVRTLRLGQALEIPPQAIVFSNELFDAQSFHRFIFKDGRWRERGVHLENGTLSEILLDEISPKARPLLADLQKKTPFQEWQVDISLEAENLLSRICAGSWRGLFVTADYGKTWDEMLELCPGGTARAFRRHRLSSDILAFPGEQDLTCDVCWSRLAQGLAKAGFGAVSLESQERFLMTHSARKIGEIISENAGKYAAQKQGLLELLHPSAMGFRFQMLHGRRGL